MGRVRKGSPPTLSFQDVLNDAKRTLLNIAQEGEVTDGMVFAIVDGEDKVAVIPCEEPPRVMVPLVLAKFRPRAWVLAAEVRGKKFEKDEDLENRRIAPGEISDNPENPEMLWVTGCERGHEQEAWFADIVTDEKGQRSFNPWIRVHGGAGGLLLEHW